MTDILPRCTHRILSDKGRIIAVCSEPLRFFGFKGYDESQERWDSARCGFYTVSAGGTIVRLTREEPPKGYFNHNHADLCKRSYGHAAG